MSEEKKDLTIPKNFVNWTIYGLSGIVCTISSVMYFDMRKQRNDCTDDNKFYAMESFKQAMKIKEQENVIKVLDTAVTESKTYIQDSIDAVNVRNFKGNIKNIKKIKR